MIGSKWKRAYQRCGNVIFGSIRLLFEIELEYQSRHLSLRLR